jgi:hypothetical protein
MEGALFATIWPKNRDGLKDKNIQKLFAPGAPRPERDFDSKKDRKMLTNNKHAPSVKMNFFSFFEFYTSGCSVLLMGRLFKFCKENFL